MEVTQDEIDYINYQMYKNNQADTRTTITDAPVLFISTVRRLFGMLETEVLQRARTATKSVLTVTTGTEPQDRESFLKLCSQV